MPLRRRVETLLLCALAALTTAMGNACMVKPQAAAAKKTLPIFPVSKFFSKIQNRNGHVSIDADVDLNSINIDANF